MAMEQYLAVIAIDFGTTFSGYAFSMRSDVNDIKMNKNWGAEAGFQGYKTPTTILIRPDGSLCSFGFQAESDFTDLDEDEIKEGYQLFQRFKMELYANKLNSEMKIKSTSGKEMSALEITAKSLSFMKKHSLDAIGKTLGKRINDNDIRWVITVPAIWSDTAKKFMRFAAKEAGLVDDMLSQNLVIALEPEAASLYCRTLALDKFIGKEGAKGKMSVKPGETYMVVDCGGGTIDITVHEILEDGTVQEVECASGGPWGGIYVDRKYYNLLSEIFGSDYINILRRDHPSTWLSMVVDFETKKRSANPDNATGINLLLSMQFASTFEKHAGESVVERIKKKKHLGVKFSNGMLRVFGDTVRGMYSEVIPQIREHLKQILSNDKTEQTVSKMFVVGGFAESAYLREFLTAEFEQDVQMFIPEETGMCVMKGAVLFGHNNRTIKSRISRFYYSVAGYRDFIPDKDDPMRLLVINNRRVMYALDRFVSRGQRIAIDDEIESITTMKYPNNTFFNVYLYSTVDDAIDDPDHHSACLLEHFQVDSPNVEKQDREVKISLCFGGTDILVKGTDLDSGIEKMSTVAF